MAERSRLTLITGGARSGKSLHAERLVQSASLPVTYVATLRVLPDDPESAERVARHRRRRSPDWRTLEVPLAVASAIASLPAGPAAVIIDCVSVFVSNLLIESQGAEMLACQAEEHILLAVRELVAAIAARDDLSVYAVTNEVGWGVVPEYPLGRAYRDILGTANQILAASADSVWLVAAGLPLRLK